MKTQAQQAKTPAAACRLEAGEREFVFPEGLLGFASYRRFMLGRYQPPDGSVSPFLILRALEEGISFPLIHPRLLVPDYQPPIPPEVVARLEARSKDELVILVIVTLREKLEDITVNLQGPLVLNPSCAKGLQLVTDDFPVRYPLLKNLPG